MLGLTSSAGKIAANGFSIVTLVAQLDPRTRPELRDVTFTTTLGAFVGAAAATPREIVVPAGSEGQALATLRAGTEPGTATVTAEVRSGGAVLAVANVQVTFERAAAADILRVNIADQTAPADGATTTAVIVQLNPDLLPSQQVVSFSTTAGSFSTLGNVVTTEVRAGSDNVARVLLVSPREPGTATVTATVSGFVGRTTVTFEAAAPDSLVALGVGELPDHGLLLEQGHLPGTALPRGRHPQPRRGGAAQRDQRRHGERVRLLQRHHPERRERARHRAEFTPGNTTERGVATIRAWVAGTSADGKVKVEIVSP